MVWYWVVEFLFTPEQLCGLENVTTPSIHSEILHFTEWISSKSFYLWLFFLTVSLISSEYSLYLPLWSQSVIIQICVFVCIHSLKVLLEHFQDVHK